MAEKHRHKSVSGNMDTFKNKILTDVSDNTFFRVNAKYSENPTETGRFMVRAKNKFQAIEKVIHYIRTYGTSAEIISVNKSTCRGFLGHAGTTHLYVCRIDVCRIDFTCSDMKHRKRRDFAIGANDIYEVCEIIRNA